MSEDETTVPGDGSNNQKKEEGAAQVPAAAVPLSSPPPATAPGASPPREDFSKILEEIKLPERREFKAAADISKMPPVEGPEPEILEEHVVKAAKGAENEPLQEKPSSVVPVRTFKDDVQTVVREKNISLVQAVSLEEEKQRGQERVKPEEDEMRKRRRRRSIGILFASIMLVVLGALALLGVVFVMKEKQAAPPPVASSSILFAEQTETLSLDGQTPQTLKQELVQAEGQELGSLGSITQIIPVVSATGTSGQAGETPATLAQFFQALGITDAPQELLSAVGPDFFFGIHVVDVNAPIFVIPVTSYDYAFAGMLAWEPTLDQDLAPVFTSVSPTVVDASTSLPEARTFQDVVMQNYDARALEDDSGNIVLYYSFPTPDILVIAQSPYSFTEILSRLQAQREL